MTTDLCISPTDLQERSRRSGRRWQQPGSRRRPWRRRQRLRRTPRQTRLPLLLLLLLLLIPLLLLLIAPPPSIAASADTQGAPFGASPAVFGPRRPWKVGEVLTRENAPSPPRGVTEEEFGPWMWARCQERRWRDHKRWLSESREKKEAWKKREAAKKKKEAKK